MRLKFGSSRHNNRSAKPPGIFGKLAFTLFLSIFLFAGLFFAYLLSKQVLEIARTQTWDSAQCTILSSKVGHQSGDNPHIVEVRYHYTYKGQRFESDRVSISVPSYSKYSKASRAQSRYPAGAEVECFVNPERPSEAVLSKDGLWVAFFLLLPLVFILVGGGGIYMVWTASTDTGISRGQEKVTSRGAGSGTKGLYIFGGIFFLAGLGMLLPLAVFPIKNVIDAKSWTPAQCTAISSRVESHRSDDGTTYSIEIFYRYNHQGREYKSDRYSFFGGSSSGRAAKQKVVDQYPAGKEFTCYLDPENPAEAVIDREFSWQVLLALIPLIFMGVGFGIMYAGRKKGSSSYTSAAYRGSSSSTGGSISGSAGYNMASTGPVELKPTSSRMGKLIGITLAALFWNGIVSVFVYQAWSSWAAGRAEWGLMLFLIPFVLIGAVLIFSIGYFFLALFNPVPVLMIDRAELMLGENTKLRWRIDGKYSRLTRFSITLEGIEEARYRRGTNTYTDHSTFHLETIVEVASIHQMPQGEAHVKIPENTMHTFEAPDNKILWKIKVTGEIPRWPDIDREHSIRVLPAKATQREDRYGIT